MGRSGKELQSLCTLPLRDSAGAYYLSVLNKRSSVEICSFWLLSCSGWLWEARSFTVVVSLEKTPLDSYAL